MTQRALQLLERYGVLTREMALAEGVEGGFAGVYPVLKLLEERGQVRRGYFVDGLGAAQFAKPGAVDLLRAMTQPDTADRTDAWVLAATDPAQPFGAALPWPESSGRPSRAIGAYAVIVDGDLCAYLERGGKRLLTFEAASQHDSWVQMLGSFASATGFGGSSSSSSRVRRLRIETIDGESANASSWAEALRAVGFTEGYKGLSKGA